MHLTHVANDLLISTHRYKIFWYSCCFCRFSSFACRFFSRSNFACSIRISFSSFVSIFCLASRSAEKSRLLWVLGGTVTPLCTVTPSFIPVSTLDQVASVFPPWRESKKRNPEGCTTERHQNIIRATHVISLFWLSLWCKRHLQPHQVQLTYTALTVCAKNFPQKSFALSAFYPKKILEFWNEVHSTRKSVSRLKRSEFFLKSAF